MKTIHSNEYHALLVWLREQRVAHGLSMRDLAGRMDVPHSWIGKIETGERRLDVCEYLHLCTVLGCDFREGINVVIKAKDTYPDTQCCGTPKVAEGR